jgi:hypothetical protein
MRIKSILVIFFGLFVTNSTQAQNAEVLVFEKLTLDVPVNEIGGFIQSHKIIMDISLKSDSRTFVGQYMAAHRYAGKHSITLYNIYESVEDINSDDMWTPIRNHADSLASIDSSLAGEFSSMVGTWWNLFLEGHNDEIRTLRTNGFGNGDWEDPLVIVYSYYTPKWADMNTFIGYWEELQPAYEQCGYVQASRSSTHYSGSGPTVETLTAFKSWEDLASWEANFQTCFETHVPNYAEINTKYWDMAGDHWDEILIPVGQIKDGVFVLSEHFNK